MHITTKKEANLEENDSPLALGYFPQLVAGLVHGEVAGVAENDRVAVLLTVLLATDRTHLVLCNKKL
jgi:hypothetical protein